MVVGLDTRAEEKGRWRWRSGWVLGGGRHVLLHYDVSHVIFIATFPLFKRLRTSHPSIRKRLYPAYPPR